MPTTPHLTTIRTFRPSDEPSWLRRRVLAFLDTCYYDDVWTSRPASPAIHLVAVEDETVVGLLDVEIEDALATIDTVAVHPDHQHRGIGTAQLSALLKPGGQTVLVPSYRYAALYPWQIEARSPYGAPPVVPYLDLRTLVEAATGRRPQHRVPTDGIRQIRAASIEALAERERQHDTVVQSDLIEPAGVDAAHVVNHPGNTILIGTARRVQKRMGLPVDSVDPGRTLLREIYAPLDEQVLDALGIDADPRPAWTLRGKPLDDDEVRQAHLAWLADKPDIVSGNLERHRQTIEVLCLG